MKTVAVIQARTGSSRLPNKVLLPLAGEAMLTRVVRRVQRARTVDEVVVATTEQPADKVIADLCETLGIRCYRGSEQDVLDRYYQAAVSSQAETVVRITADCPLVDPEVIDRAVSIFRTEGRNLQYVVTLNYPDGLDAEVFSFAALERAWREDQNPEWREHVTAYFYWHPELFNQSTVNCPEDLSALQWTVDTPEDFELARRIYEHFGNDGFGWREALEHMRKHPALFELNRDVKRNAMFFGR